MYFLNDLDDYKLYRNRKIVNIDRQDKEYKKNTCVLLIGENPNFNILTNNIFYGAYFNSYFVPFKFLTTKKKKIVKLDQENIYNKIETSDSNLTIFRKNITMYKKRNLIYDFTYELNSNLLELKSKGISYITKYVNEIANKISTIPYKNKIVAIEVKKGISLTSISALNANGYVEMLYLALKKKLADSVEGITFLLYTDNGCYIKFKYNKNEKLPVLNKTFTKIIKVANSDAKDIIIEDEPPKKDAYVSDDVIQKDIKIDNIKKMLIKNLGITKDKPAGRIVNNQLNKLEDLISNKLNSMNVAYENMDDDALLNIIGTEPEIVKEIEITKDIATQGIYDDQEIKRLRRQQEPKYNKNTINKLQTKQDEVIYDGKKLKDILQEVNDLKIDEHIIENDSILNNEVKHDTVSDFDKSYSEKQLKKDILNTFTAFNEDEDIPLFVKSIKSENTSDNFTKKMTYHVIFQDAKGVSHTVNINYPILKDGKFFLLNGGKKLLLKQLMLLPIVKTKPNTVQVSTNYNKLFITRFGSKLNDGVVNLKKLLLTNDINDHINKESNLLFKLGNVLPDNKGFAASLEYGELSRNIMFIENNIYYIDFNLREINKILNDQTYISYDTKLGKFEYDEKNYFCIGWLKTKQGLLLSSLDNSNIFIFDGKNYTKVDDNLILFLLNEIFKKSLSEEKIKEFYSYSESKTLTFNRVRITNKAIPLIIVLAYERGLTDIMDRYNIEYEFVEQERIAKKFGQKKLKFANGFLLYNSLDLKSTLLLDGLTTIETSEYNFEEMNEKTPYIEWFYDNCGSRNTGKGIHNMLSLMIDPITKEILTSLKLPTNIIDVMLYANTLLSNSSYKTANDMSCYRVRGQEQINAVLYKVLADSFKTYKDTNNNGNPIKISLDPDILIKTMVAHKTVDEYSILNPSLELDKVSAATFKGPNGKKMPSYIVIYK